ncbi:MAG: LemA family protein [Phycisphaerales bacterium]|nr:MAG: LemA family protein [Phycisphaerales bacterium]
MIMTLIVLGIPLLVVIFVITIYNRLQRKRIAVENAWSDIDVQLKRRHDLVPNLVNTVKGYAAHEKETLDAVIQARNSAANAGDVKQQAGAENMLTQSLGKLFALAEAYPDLKANQNFMQLQEELTSTENKIGFARQHFNRNVSQYNESLAVFPNNIIAGMFNFEKRDFFEIEDPAQKEVPQVSF